VEKKKRIQGQSIFRKLIFALKNGSYATKVSFFVMGFGQIARGQIVKGLLYLSAQFVFWLYIFLFGGRYVAHLFSGDLGKNLSGERWNEELQIFEKIKGDNSFLILLYGVASLLIAILRSLHSLRILLTYNSEYSIRSTFLC
jgi:arabinogalactan oligomer/maltooligosaccharide transport system permease protein